MKPRPKIFASLKQAASKLGLDRDLVSTAKAAGCSAFNSNGTVDGEVLKAWLADPANMKALGDSTSLKEKELYERWRKLKIANDKTEGRLIERNRVAETVQRLGAKVQELLLQKLCNEYPAAVAGLDVAQARVYGNRLRESILKEFQSLATEWR